MAKKIISLFMAMLVGFSLLAHDAVPHHVMEGGDVCLCAAVESHHNGEDCDSSGHDDCCSHSKDSHGGKGCCSILQDIAFEYSHKKDKCCDTCDNDLHIYHLYVIYFTERPLCFTGQFSLHRHRPHGNCYISVSLEDNSTLRGPPSISVL